PKINIELHDTIGMLALDESQNLSGACTTSGLAYKLAGRVGDSPIIGAGLFVDNEVGAATSTGMGEAVLKSVGSFLVVELMRQGMTPAEACEEAVMRIVRKQPNYKEIQVGYLAMDKAGNVGAFAIQAGFVYAVTRNGKTEVIDAKSYLT
ncbi:MAG: isoaspartyl peptidase/L-asparaginase, partial [Bacteroidota bacterium]